MKLNKSDMKLKGSFFELLINAISAKIYYSVKNLNVVKKKCIFIYKF